MKQPLLAAPERAYIDGLYQHLLTEGLPNATGDENADLLLGLRDINPPPGDDSTAMGVVLVWDIRDTFDNYPRDSRNLDGAFIEKTNHQTTILKAGVKIGKWAVRYGFSDYDQDDSPYSYEAVAAGATHVVRLMYGLDKRREFRQFVGLLKVPPVSRKHIGKTK